MLLSSYNRGVTPAADASTWSESRSRCAAGEVYCQSIAKLSFDGTNTKSKDGRLRTHRTQAGGNEVSALQTTLALGSNLRQAERLCTPM